MRINHNIAALNTYRQFNNANNAQSKSMEKLSSGLRINSAADDAAGLAISEKMRGQIRGLDMASKNAQDGISLIQTAEGALNESHDILQRMRELVVQAGNTGTQGTDDLTAIQDEIDALQGELGGESGSKGITDRAQFNGKNLLDGSFSGTFQIGANEQQQITLSIKDMSADALGSMSGTGASATLDVSINEIDVTNFGTGSGQISFDDQLKSVDAAIKQVSAERSNLGATQTRLEHTINNLNVSSENLTSAESRIRDVDYALAA
ncbi:flagellin Hag [Priestia megaterium]|uniref:flagellin Hag n=1 Tax=Priestia megaterium TaxID=1404 RepID=UPI00204267EF|nr:flagellin Hag [Priestia megaterium]MCM3194105.1 flagellin Hag [Priestia megaterium]